VRKQAKRRRNAKDTALITGASGGIGEALAHELASHGHDVVIVARSRGKLEQLASRLSKEKGVNVRVIVKDLSLPGSAEQIFEELESRHVEVDILVNNAGFGLWRHFAVAEWSAQEEMLRLNITTLAHLTRLFLPGMLRRHRGMILNVGSTGSFAPTPAMAVYSATKAFVLSFSFALAEELRGTDVSVTVLCPGNTVTGFSARAGSQGSRLASSNGMSSEAVARIGYKAMMNRRRKVVAGFVNKLSIAALRVLPRAFTVRMTGRLMSQD
jgi:short-subunit dehydrogenase